MQTRNAPGAIVEKAALALPGVRPSYLYCKNQLLSRRFKAQIERDFRRQDLILVHQMGKVGSTSVVNALHQSDLAQPIYKTHYLNPGTVKTMWEQKVSFTKRQVKTHYLANRYLSELIARHGISGKRWKVISLVREPVGGNISRMFQSINDYVPHFRKRWREGTIDADDLISVYFDEFPYHEWALSWFDRELLDVFGIDVFAEPFPKKRGYRIYSGDGLDLLLVKLERLNVCAKHAFEDFLHIEGFRPVRANTANTKSYQEAYRAFRKGIAFPPDYLNLLLSSQYTHHFYDKREIQAIRNRWPLHAEVDAPAPARGPMSTAV